MVEILEKVGPTNFFLHSGSEKVGGANFFHHFLELQRPSNIFNDTRRGKTCPYITGSCPTGQQCFTPEGKESRTISHTSPGSRRDYKPGAQLCKHKARGPLAASQGKHATLLSCPTGQQCFTPEGKESRTISHTSPGSRLNRELNCVNTRLVGL